MVSRIPVLDSPENNSSMTFRKRVLRAFAIATVLAVFTGCTDTPLTEKSSQDPLIGEVHSIAQQWLSPDPENTAMISGSLTAAHKAAAIHTGTLSTGREYAILTGDAVVKLKIQGRHGDKPLVDTCRIKADTPTTGVFNMLAWRRYINCCKDLHTQNGCGYIMTYISTVNNTDYLTTQCVV